MGEVLISRPELSLRFEPFRAGLPFAMQRHRACVGLGGAHWEPAIKLRAAVVYH